MAAAPSRSFVLSFAGLAAVTVAAPWLAGWVPPTHLIEVTGLALGAIAAACLRTQDPATAHRAIMPPVFVIVFTTLLLELATGNGRHVLKEDAQASVSGLGGFS